MKIMTKEMWKKLGLGKGMGFCQVGEEIVRMKVVKGIRGNPSRIKNIGKLIERARVICKKSGQDFVLLTLDGSPNRIIINKLFDIIETDDVDDETSSDHIRNVNVDDIIVVNGLFHTLKEFVLCCLNFVKDVAPNILDALGYKTEKHQDWVADAKDMHRAGQSL